jgi:hypothetical protein
MSGISKRNFRMFRELCGDTALNNVLIVTNMWGIIENNQGERREHQLATDSNLFGSAIKAGARMIRHLNTLQSAEVIMRRIITNYPVPLGIQVEIIDEHLKLGDTGAGKVLYEDQQKTIEEHKQEIEKIKDQMETANEAARKELLEEIQDRDTRIKTALNNMNALKREWSTEEIELQQRIRRLERPGNDAFSIVMKAVDFFFILFERYGMRT